MNKEQWGKSLKSYSDEQRQKTPVADQSTFSEEEQWHYRMIGGEYVAWLNEGLSKILEQRYVLKVMGFDPEPLILLTTSMPGLVAAHQIMEEVPDHFIFLLHHEFEAWQKKNPPEDFTFHIHHWSYVHGLNREQLERAREIHPEIKKDDFCLHSTGDLWGNNCGNFEEHLWHWTGNEMELLEMNFISGVY